MHLACWFGHTKTCAVLIQHHAPLNMQDQAGRTPLHFACQHNRPEIVQLLIQAGADTTIKNTNGKTAEQIAVQEDKINIIELLQNAHKDKSKQNDSTGDKPPEVFFMEEHERLKKLIDKLISSRDEQTDQLSTIQDRLEKQKTSLASLEIRQNDLRKELEGLSSCLHATLNLLLTMKPQQTETIRSNPYEQRSTSNIQKSLMSLQPPTLIPSSNSLTADLSNQATTPSFLTQRSSSPPIQQSQQASTLLQYPQNQGMQQQQSVSSFISSQNHQQQQAPIKAVKSLPQTSPPPKLCSYCHKNPAEIFCRDCKNQFCKECISKLKICPFCHK